MKIINLSTINGSNGFRLDGAAEGHLAGTSVSNAGDVNGDGFDDVLIGAPRANPANYSNGSIYLVFGKASGFSAEIDLSTLDGSNGSRLDAGKADDPNGVGAGKVISSAGDVNGDELDDMIFGAPYFGFDFPIGISYVLFGKTSGFGAAFALSELDGKSGFLIGPGGYYSFFGSTVSTAGDINGDGFDEVIVGSPGSGDGPAYGSFVITYGSSGIGHESIGVSAEKYDALGETVSSAGDINGDGFDDVIVSSKNYFDLSASYVILGGSGFDGNLANLDGSNGFRLVWGIEQPDRWGAPVSEAGDINGDGYDDLISGSYVVFGKAAGFDARLDISNLDGSNGFRFDSGGWGTSAGDVNGDGFGDLLIGGRDEKGDGSGSSYVVYGKASNFSPIVDLPNLDDIAGFRLDGVSANDSSGNSVSSAGDVNGDGFDDLIIGAAGADPNGERSGSSYVFFGGNFTNAVTFLGSSGVDELISGTPAAESFVAGNGSDTMSGGGGADVFHGGEGDDIIQVADLDFQLADGGSGSDTLILASNDANFDLSTIRNKLSGIEIINLKGNGNNEITLSALDLLNLSDNSNTLKVEGDAGDRIFGLSSGWIDGGIVENYQIYTQGAAELQVNTSVSTDFPVSGLIDLSNLNGDNGFRIDGVMAGDSSGGSVSNAGDVNGDGFDDLIIGTGRADWNGYYSGSSYVVFGKATGFDANLNLSSLDGNNGFRLDVNGDASFLLTSGTLVSSAGDINGDGFGDLFVGDHIVGRDFLGPSGSRYVVFGKASGFDAAIDLSDLDGNNGFRLVNKVSLSLDRPANNAGDVNGDGFDDVIVISREGFVSLSSSYVVFGKASGIDVAPDLSSLDGSNGFRMGFRLDLEGQHTGNRLNSASSAGDINGDGFDDMIVGYAFVNGDNYSTYYSETSFVVFGKATGFDAAIELSNLDGNNGFHLDGRKYSGGVRSVSSAGDINGDGFDDVAISGADSYVVFGKAAGFEARLDLASLNGSNGFRLDADNGLLVSDAGDVNGDGFDDLIVGEPGADPNGIDSGSSYVVFGRASDFSATMDLSSLDGNSGFRLGGVRANDYSGWSVSGAGDVNSDGFDDVIIGAPGTNPNGENSGSSYVIFGRSDFGGGGNDHVIPGTPGDDILRGTSAAEIFEAGDGNDLLIGRGGADVFRGGAGVDQIKVPDLSFQSIDGGTGNDILHLDGKDLNLDLTALGGKIQGIETICIYGRGDNTLALTVDSVLNLSDTSNALKLHGNAGDHVTVQDEGWIDGGVQGFYHTYVNDDAVLLVGANLAIDFV